MDELLKYGALGICAIVLLLCAGVIRREQHRDEEPRKFVLVSLYVFMFFSFVIAGAALVSEHFSSKSELEASRATISELNTRIEELETKLADCNSLRHEAAQEQIVFLRAQANRISYKVNYTDTAMARVGCSFGGSQREIVTVRGTVRIPENQDVQTQLRKQAERLERNSSEGDT